MSFETSQVNLSNNANARVTADSLNFFGSLLNAQAASLIKMDEKGLPNMQLNYKLDGFLGGFRAVATAVDPVSGKATAMQFYIDNKSVPKAQVLAAIKQAGYDFIAANNELVRRGMLKNGVNIVANDEKAMHAGKGILAHSGLHELDDALGVEGDGVVNPYGDLVIFDDKGNAVEVNSNDKAMAKFEEWLSLPEAVPAAPTTPAASTTDATKAADAAKAADAVRIQGSKLKAMTSADGKTKNVFAAMAADDKGVGATLDAAKIIAGLVDIDNGSALSADVAKQLKADTDLLTVPNFSLADTLEKAGLGAASVPSIHEKIKAAKTFTATDLAAAITDEATARVLKMHPEAKAGIDKKEIPAIAILAESGMVVIEAPATGAAPTGAAPTGQPAAKDGTPSTTAAQKQEQPAGGLLGLGKQLLESILKSRTQNQQVQNPQILNGANAGIDPATLAAMQSSPQYMQQVIQQQQLLAMQNQYQQPQVQSSAQAQQYAAFLAQQQYQNFLAQQQGLNVQNPVLANGTTASGMYSRAYLENLAKTDAKSAQQIYAAQGHKFGA